MGVLLPPLGKPDQGPVPGLLQDGDVGGEPLVERVPQAVLAHGHPPQVVPREVQDDSGHLVGAPAHHPTELGAGELEVLVADGTHLTIYNQF